MQRFRGVIFSFHRLLEGVNPSKGEIDVVRLFLTSMGRLEEAYNRLMVDFIACEKILLGWSQTYAVFHDAIQVSDHRTCLL
jgi:hypothetical protein